MTNDVITGDILATIDAATDGLCACGCRRPLDPAGPSAWWATEACQGAWQSGRPRVVGAEDIRLLRAADITDLLAAINRAIEAFARFARDIAERLRPLVTALVVAAKPADPVQRALELRRNRNTGPKTPQRAPRRIDPRRAR